MGGLPNWLSVSQCPLASLEDICYCLLVGRHDTAVKCPTCDSKVAGLGLGFVVALCPCGQGTLPTSAPSPPKRD